jgi:enamine deaminase RidA (YjgF/YER057c/UK114 family)
MSCKLINPDALGAPSGYSHGVLVDGGGKLLFIAGQIAWDQNRKIVSNDFVEQFDKALANVITVVKAAGGESNNIVRVVVYVTNKHEYLAQTKAVGERYRKHMGKHFPAMVLVQVASLLDDSAKVEIEATAVI